MKTAFITGATGQDGTYLTLHLLKNGYTVYALCKSETSSWKNLTTLMKWEREDSALLDNLVPVVGDILDGPTMTRYIKDFQPTEIYSLAAQSHVGKSFYSPIHTINTNVLGPLNLLEGIVQHSPYSKFYQASTSEMFGTSVDKDGMQRETTPMRPASPYAAAKMCAHNLVHQYRDGRDVFACAGILFNHESILRGENFVTTKIVKAAVNIANGYQERLQLGSVDSYRDWGHAQDYVKAMHLMLHEQTPTDYVVATGTCHSVQYVCEYVFERLGMQWDLYTDVASSYERRDVDVKYLKGDSKKIRQLFWTPQFTLEDILDEMIDFYRNTR